MIDGGFEELHRFPFEVCHSRESRTQKLAKIGRKVILRKRARLGSILKLVQDIERAV